MKACTRKEVRKMQRERLLIDVEGRIRWLRQANEDLIFGEDGFGEEDAREFADRCRRILRLDQVRLRLYRLLNEAWVDQLPATVRLDERLPTAA